MREDKHASWQKSFLLLFLEVSTMTEEFRLVAVGMPIEDAITVCHALRRERDRLPEFIRLQEEKRRQLEEQHEWLLTV